MIDLETVKSQALRLLPEDRATLVEILLTSLGLGGPDAVQESLVEETRRRRVEVASGEVRLHPGDELLAALESGE